jgi:hypothetical protein
MFTEDIANFLSELKSPLPVNWSYLSSPVKWHRMTFYETEARKADAEVWLANDAFMLFEPIVGFLCPSDLVGGAHVSTLMVLDEAKRIYVEGYQYLQGADREAVKAASNAEYRSLTVEQYLKTGRRKLLVEDQYLLNLRQAIKNSLLMN